MEQNPHYHPTPFPDSRIRPEIHSFRVDVASSLAFVQFLKIVAATASPASLSSIAANHLVDSTSLRGLAALLQALPNLRTLSLNGSHSAQILQEDLASALPRLRALTIAGLIIVESTPRGLMNPTWESLRSVAACPIRSVQVLILRFTLEGRRLEDSSIRYGLALRTLDWPLLDAVLDAYANVVLELELDRPSLAVSQAQMAEILRVVENVARGWMSERARQSVQLRVYW
ncbi:hypothetical protein PsYK624_107780 [Phanerochaete sordida]|uniref:Uncharacterized protein n=1 Tax=Phanerochaete sordida TaxID=48140 RepID=A0A9P3GEI9_9APHY|nr:hypothetical protein PsYK624_107780 [Phanerochaete sordida]